MSWVTLNGELLNKTTLVHFCKITPKEKWVARNGLYVLPIILGQVRFDSKINHLIKKFKPVSTSIVVLDSNAALDWHHDKYRKCGINVLLEKCHSYTLYGDLQAIPLRLTVNFNIINYEVGKPILFDTTRYHTAINLDDKPRFLLTLDFENETYGQLYDEASEIGAIAG